MAVHLQVNPKTAAQYLPAASSVMYQHICAVIFTELAARPSQRRIRVLDVGCGDGALLAYMHSAFAEVLPDLELVAHGLEVLDHGVQPPGFFELTLRKLSQLVPQVSWQNRLHAASTASAWPLADESFDVVVSNQVGEHAADHERFFAEVARTLGTEGFSVHLFPMGRYLFEGHLGLPLVHWISDHDLLRSAIAAASRLGFGKFTEHKNRYGTSVDSFSEAHADYLAFNTNYTSFRRLTRVLRSCGLRCSRRYTDDLYRSKVRSLLSLPVRAYYPRRNPLLSTVLAEGCSYISSVTLFAEKRNVYRAPAVPG